MSTITDLRPGQITYRARLIDGTVITRTAWLTGTPGLAVSEAYRTCQARDAAEGPCWVVVHVRSGRTFPFCWSEPGPAVEFAHHAVALGPWDIGEAAVDRRTALPFVRRWLTRLAGGLDACYHSARVAPSGIDNPVPAGGSACRP